MPASAGTSVARELGPEEVASGSGGFGVRKDLRRCAPKEVALR